MSKLVHEALDCECVDEATDGAQRTRAHWQTIENVMDYFLVREIVYWDGVALASWLASRHGIDARRLRERRINVPCGQQRRALLQPGPCDVRIAPHLMAPIEDTFRAVNRARHGDNHGGTVRRPGELVLMRPLQPHRVSRHRSREQHGVERRVIGAVMPVAPSPLHVMNCDRIELDAERCRDVFSGRVDRLALTPDFDCSALPARNGTGRADGSMRQERPRIGSAQSLGTGSGRDALLT